MKCYLSTSDGTAALLIAAITTVILAVTLGAQDGVSPHENVPGSHLPDRLAAATVAAGELVRGAGGGLATPNLQENIIVIVIVIMALCHDVRLS